MKEIAFPKFTVSVPDHWFDVTAELEGDSPPLTIAPEDGLGALQFSLAPFPVKEAQSAVLEKLCSLLKDFATGHQLGQPQSVVAAESPRPQLAANFHWDGDLLRVWYVADQGQLAFLTYTCEKNAAFANELQQAEEIVRTLRFRKPEA
jgi:hypothetical protein